MVGGGVLECFPEKFAEKLGLGLDMNQGVHFQSFCFFFFQIQDLVVGPGDKISCTYSRVIEKEVDLLTMRKKTSNKKAVL